MARKEGRRGGVRQTTRRRQRFREERKPRPQPGRWPRRSRIVGCKADTLPPLRLIPWEAKAKGHYDEARRPNRRTRLRRQPCSRQRTNKVLEGLTEEPELDNQGAVIMTHRDRSCGPSGRSQVRGRCGASSRPCDALRRAAWPTETAAFQGFRTALRAARDAPHRHAPRALPKTLGNRLYESILRTFGIKLRSAPAGDRFRQWSAAPRRSGHFVGHRHGSNLRRFSRHEIAQPRVLLEVCLSSVSDHSHGAGDQQPSEISISLFGDPAHALLAAGRGPSGPDRSWRPARRRI